MSKRPIAKLQRCAGGKEPAVPGRYVVTSEGGGGGPPIFWDFETLEEAMRCAREEWAVGVVDIYGLNGECLNPDNWHMPQRINLVRLRRGQLNPRQELALERWLDSGLGKCYNEVASNPKGIIETVADIVGDLEKAINLVEEAWASGLLEIISWIDGTDFPDRKAVDKRIADGDAVAI